MELESVPKKSSRNCCVFGLFVFQSPGGANCSELRLLHCLFLQELLQPRANSEVRQGRSTHKASRRPPRPLCLSYNVSHKLLNHHFRALFKH